MTKDHRSVGDVDSHKETIHVAVISAMDEPLADQEFATTRAGYRRAVAWLIEHGPLQAVGIQGTSSYGVGSTAVAQAGTRVIEVNRTRPPSDASRARPTGAMPTGRPDQCCPGKQRRTRSGPRSSRFAR